jgi:bifunctional non-homologous end joining protein LigD
MATPSSTLTPMLASTSEAPLDSPAFAYEPKYDGIRAIAIVNPREVTLWSRLGNQKTAQFPGIVEALLMWARTIDRPVVLDGEIVALDAKGDPAGFQDLQRSSGTTALIVFDLLMDGRDDLRTLPLHERRARLEALTTGFGAGRGGSDPPVLRISEQVIGDGRALYERAKQRGWEGVIAKRVDSVYKSGKRSSDWCKLKLVRHQTCVVGGWTEPRGSRPFFGALLLGVYGATPDARPGHPEAGLQYIGHTGAGFTDAELGRVWKQIQALGVRASPFTTTPKTNEKPHWTKPRLVVEVKFTEWTADGKLRHPTYLGIRDDVTPRSVTKEPLVSRPAVRASVHRGEKAIAAAADRRKAPAAGGRRVGADAKSRSRGEATSSLIDQLRGIEDAGGDGTLDLPGGGRFDVSNLTKPFWPKLKLTKGDLLRHYARVAPFILPALADRPLVMKRYPSGVAGKPFYQHRAPDKVPAGVRVEKVETGSETRAHLIGGDLATLLYTAQLGAVSQDPWFSRVGSETIADHVAIDLDPPDGMKFDRVLDVAQWVRDELAGLKAIGFPKTSGAGGLHIYVPMPPGTTYELALIYCQIVATLVANKHPKLATIERSIAARGNRIYVDYLQNIQGKTLASAYSPRANDFAGVSTPLTWDEVEDGVTPQDFTVANFAERLAAVGDRWAGLRKAKGADLKAVIGGRGSGSHAEKRRS